MLSLQLDRIPFLPVILDPEQLPQMHLAPNLDDDTAPEAYSERLLQARLASFWQKYSPLIKREYDATATEERYERFCSEFLATLPAVFALEPSKQWDEKLKRLPMQRHILHIAIYERLCRNYRPLLLCGATQIQSLPAYKQVLLSLQRKASAVAALKVLDEVSKLHAKLGGSYSRVPDIVLPTFEAAVLLVYMCQDAQFPGSNVDDPVLARKNDPLGSGRKLLSRERCLQATRDALARLRTLSEVSIMAEGGANVLARLLGDGTASSSPNKALRISNPSSEREARPLSSVDVVPSAVGTPSSSEMGHLGDFLLTHSAVPSPARETLVGGYYISMTSPLE